MLPLIGFQVLGFATYCKMHRKAVGVTLNV